MHYDEPDDDDEVRRQLDAIEQLLVDVWGTERLIRPDDVRGDAATLRDAHVRDFETILLSDGCGAFKRETHDVTIASLSSVSPVMTCAEALEMVESEAGA